MSSNAWRAARLPSLLLIVGLAAGCDDSGSAPADEGDGQESGEGEGEPGAPDGGQGEGEGEGEGLPDQPDGGAGEGEGAPGDDEGGEGEGEADGGEGEPALPAACEGLEEQVPGPSIVLDGVAFQYDRLLLNDDRFAGEVEMALPYREFIYEQEPTAQWVHGGLALTYRLPRFLHRRLAGQLDITSAVSRYVRSAELAQSFLSFKVDVFPGLAVFLPWEVTLKLGLAIDYNRVFDLEQSPQVTTPLPKELGRARYLGRVEVGKVFRDGTLRLDQQDQVSLRLDMGGSAQGEWLLDVRLDGQLVVHFGRHDLLLRGRAVFIGGDVRFWDEVELAGDYLRCYFDDRYWVREALQASVAFRFAVLRWFKVGVFHDAAGFRDRSHPDAPLSAALAFGPGLHFLIFDLFSLDVYYAFGFSPEGFDHNLSLGLQRAF